MDKPLKEKRHYWYSEKQREARCRFSELQGRHRNYAMIDGKEVEYTEATQKKRPFGKWDDYKYLGYGEYSRSKKS